MDSRLGGQIKQLVGALNTVGVQFALIGGLALASHKVIRATQDIDLLIDADEAEKANELLIKLGYHCLHRSNDASNYLRNDERVDLLYASRPHARYLLNSAAQQETSFGILRVVSTEGLIGFKLQAIVNNPRRTQDIEDIRALMRENRDAIDMTRSVYISASSIERPCLKKSSMTSAKIQSAPDTGQPLSGGAFIDNLPASRHDPYEQLDGLMEVIEALCPRWPYRETFKDSDVFLL